MAAQRTVPMHRAPAAVATLLQVAVDRQKASDLGLSASNVGFLVETLIAGTPAGTFREQGKERDLILIGTERGAARMRALDHVMLYPPRGGSLQ